MKTLQDFKRLPIGTKLNRLNGNSPAWLHPNNIPEAIVGERTIIRRNKVDTIFNGESHLEHPTHDTAFIREGILWYRAQPLRFLEDEQKKLTKYIKNKESIIANFTGNGYLQNNLSITDAKARYKATLEALKTNVLRIKKETEQTRMGYCVIS